MRKLVVFFLLTLPGFASAAELKDVNAAVALTDRVMQQASAGHLREGLELLRPYVVIPSSEFDSAIGQMELQTPVFSSRFGKLIGYELIRNDAVGASLAQPVYLLKFEKHALVWRFVFYKGEKGWVLNTFKYADDLSSLL